MAKECVGIVILLNKFLKFHLFEKKEAFNYLYKLNCPGGR